MLGALYVSQTGLSAQDTNLKVISNNLANISTAGFKKDRAEFEDLLYQIRRQPGADSADSSQLPSGLQLGSGVRVVATQKNFNEGDFIITDQPLDVAINGRGFLQVSLPTGEISYTRAGNLKLSANNELVTAEGYQLNPAITLPAEVQSITIGNSGTVQVVTAGNQTPQTVGQIQTADFVNPTGLQAIGQNLFFETAASGAPIVGNPGENGRGILRQGILEASNVDAAEELVDMITTQRAYEMNSKVIQTADEMLAYVTQQL